MDINHLLDTAKTSYARWATEQDPEATTYLSHAEDFFSSYLYGDLVEHQDKDATEIGIYVKAYMIYVEGVLGDIDDK